jgi:hypothetical protein
MNNSTHSTGAIYARAFGVGVVLVFLGVLFAGCRTETQVRSVEILEPADGAVLAGPDVRVVLAAHGVDIVPAGTQQENSGHHHLFIDRDVSPPGQPIPAGEPGVVHLGGGQTEYLIKGLSPGTHRVIAVVGDWAHVPVGTVAADTVTFTVQQ